MSVKRILVIDDERNLCIIIKACLEKIGRWEVIITQSGYKGLLLAEAELPDAIMLDVIMPDINGVDLFKKLQSYSATQNIPIILLTAKVQKVDLNKFAQLDVAGVIPKPFDPLKLADRVAEILNWK